jgi:8-oxo-dGTP pyrophosphatase MutT (NUDIX family)
MTDIRITPVADLDLSYSPKPWTFADERRAEIAAHFAAQQRRIPALWNGKVLLMHEHAFAGGALRGSYLETDFASFLAWRDWGFPDKDIRNGFALAALQGADGAFLLGVMSPQTSNAGKMYFPGGTPEPADIVAGKVDLACSVMRELAEETGLTAADVAFSAGWHAVLDGARVAMMKTMHGRESAADLRARILQYLAREAAPELSDIRIVRGPEDLDPMMPDYMIAFLKYFWR